MTPLTVTAHLMSPPIVTGPLYLDGMLLAAIGARMGAAHPSGWVDEALVLAEPLPLARVETAHGWWWAASHVLPTGPEAGLHLNRVPLVEEAGRWTDRRTLNVAAGPDKRLRTPKYYRPGMLRLTWTVVGDRDAIVELLPRVTGIGPLIGHGWGWVTRWEVVSGGPPLADYGHELALRHLPVEVRPMLPERVMRRQIPLRPPYHRRREGVACWQVQP